MEPLWGACVSCCAAVPFFDCVSHFRYHQGHGGEHGHKKATDGGHKRGGLPELSTSVVENTCVASFSAQRLVLAMDANKGCRDLLYVRGLSIMMPLFRK